MPEKSAFGHRELDRVLVFVFLALGAGVARLAFLSLHWRFTHDTSILLYVAFLMDEYDFVPYRDILDQQMPGTYLIHQAIGVLTNYSDVWVRTFDLTLLAAIGGLTWRWMRAFGRLAAWAGALLWGFLYLSEGPTMSLQREYILLLPVAAGMCLILRPPAWRPGWRWFGIGLCFGLAATIKPQTIIGLPTALISRPDPPAESRGAIKRLPASMTLLGLGALLPIAGVVAYLGLRGAIPPFVDMALGYWPLYSHLNDSLEPVTGLRRIAFDVEGYRQLGGLALWLAPAFMGAFVASRDGSDGSRRGQRVACVAAMAFLFSLHPVLSGQFWDYHWIPFYYFVCQLSCLCLAERNPRISMSERAFPAAVLFLTLAFSLDPSRCLMTWDGRGGRLRSQEIRAEKISRYLRRNAPPGTLVQPLDCTGGVVDAMLRCRMRLATRFLYDLYFYHDVSAPYIQGLRRSFLDELDRARPAFIIETTGEDKPWPSGPDTSREFPGLRRLLEEKYTVAKRWEGCVIYRAREGNGSARAKPPG